MRYLEATMKLKKAYDLILPNPRRVVYAPVSMLPYYDGVHGFRCFTTWLLQLQLRLWYNM